MQPKTILFVGGGRESVPGIELAKDLGLTVVVSDASADSPGIRLADHSIYASTYDPDETLLGVNNFLKNGKKIDGVLALGSDVPTTVAHIANTLNIQGISLDSARLFSNKIEMKQKFLDNKINTPWFKKLLSVTELRRVLQNTNKYYVIKPADSRGARGVLRINSSSDINWAFAFAKSQSRTGQVIIEEYLEGPQFSTESIVIGGKSFTIGFSDRNYEFIDKFAPHIIENGGHLPSSITFETKMSICNLIDRAARALGVSEGTVKGDVVLHNDTPYIIELTGRLSGGYFCTHEIPLNTGVNFVKLAIKQALRLDLSREDLTPIINRGVAQRYFFPIPGTVTSITIPSWIKSDPEVSLLDMRISVGDVIHPTTNHTSRAGTVITFSDSREQAIYKAEKIVNEISIETLLL